MSGALEPPCSACEHGLEFHLRGWGRCTRRGCDCHFYEEGLGDLIDKPGEPTGLTAVLDVELWLVDPLVPGGHPTLVRPLATNAKGEGTPGAWAPPPIMVLRPGALVQIVP